MSVAVKYFGLQNTVITGIVLYSFIAFVTNILHCKQIWYWKLFVLRILFLPKRSLDKTVEQVHLLQYVVHSYRLLIFLKSIPFVLMNNVCIKHFYVKKNVFKYV